MTRIAKNLEDRFDFNAKGELDGALEKLRYFIMLGHNPDPSTHFDVAYQLHEALELIYNVLKEGQQ